MAKKKGGKGGKKFISISQDLTDLSPIYLDSSGVLHVKTLYATYEKLIVSNIPSPILYFDADSYNESQVVTREDTLFVLLTDLVDGQGEFLAAAKYQYSNGYLQLTSDVRWGVYLSEANKTIEPTTPMSVEFYGDIQSGGCIFSASNNLNWCESFALYSMLDENNNPYVRIDTVHGNYSTYAFDTDSFNFSYGLHHFIMVRDVDKNQFLTYMDGSLVSTINYTGNMLYGAMGSINEIWEEGNDLLTGGFKHLKMYDVALTADEVSYIYNSIPAEYKIYGFAGNGSRSLFSRNLY